MSRAFWRAGRALFYLLGLLEDGMKIHSSLLIAALLSGTACSNVTFHTDAAARSCQVGTFTKDELMALKTSQFAELDDEATNQFALDLLPCVGNPDPEIRDGIVFESLSYLLRNDKLNDTTKTKLMTSLKDMLAGDDDKGGFLKPFAALGLAEVVRADRITPYLSDLQRAELVAATVEYLTSIRDYRGYDDKQGWRHGVAHASDLALQLVLNDQIIEPQLRALRVAVQSQIVPVDGHAYIHGESERLARPILFMARRGVFNQADWNAWFMTLVDPAPFEAWGDVFTSEEGLAKLHDTKAFLNAVYVNAAASQNENVTILAFSALEALKTLP